jgi:hypothetical protein
VFERLNIQSYRFLRKYKIQNTPKCNLSLIFGETKLNLFPNTVLREIFVPNTVPVNVPQRTALSLLSRAVYRTKHCRPDSHFLNTTTSLSAVTVSAVPLYL